MRWASWIPTASFASTASPSPAAIASGPLNGNRSFEPQTDVLAPVDTVITLDPAHPAATQLALTVVNPHAPGSVRGAVLDSLADTSGVLRVVASSDQDSTLRATVEADKDHEFDLELRAGVWRVRAFRDLDGNRMWDRDRERASDPISITIRPTEDVVDVKLRLRPTAGGP
jgi:hypothetical protein